MKPNTVFKQAYNRGLAELQNFAVADDIGSEPAWSQTLAVSRTTVRTMLANFAAAGLIAHEGRRKLLLRHPVAADFYPQVETEQVGVVVEKRFMSWMLHGDCKPEQTINVLELSRQFGVSASAINHYLNRFRPHGLLERHPRGGWVFRGFTEAFAEELCEVRTMFELRSALRFITLPDDEPVWEELARIKADHLALLEHADARYTEFSELDERFHRCVNDASRNRFIVDFYDVISMIFHYHYQWNKQDERERNIVAMREHLDYIDALQNRTAAAVAERCNAHMATARLTLLASIHGFGDAPGADAATRSRKTRDRADRGPPAAFDPER